MIRFSLHCEKNHEFEAWFSHSRDFDTQKSQGLLSCPFCGSHNVEKSLMTPAIVKNTTPRESVNAPHQTATSNSTPPRPPIATQESVSLSKTAFKRLRDFVKALKKDSEDVGHNFVEEAKKIHFGEAKRRKIHGTAQLEEIAALEEEGIAVVPLPKLPEDYN